MRRIFGLLAALFLLIPMSLSGQALRTYTTTFSGGVASILSEGGNWLNGKTDGVKWKDFYVTAGGNAKGYSPQVPECAPLWECDPAAVVKGPWSPNQRARGTVFYDESKRLPSTLAGWGQEIELHLRTTISKGPTGAGLISGYEIDWRAGGPSSRTPYLEFWKWLGPYQQDGEQYVNVCSNENVGVDVHSGDVLEATVTGGATDTVLTAFKNGVQMMQCLDTGTGKTQKGNIINAPAFLTGNPGIGADFACDAAKAAAIGRNCNDIGNYGFTDFTASDLTATDNTPPTPPSQLQIR